jgi:hypothetical protein
MLAERRDAAARRADQCGKTAADVDMQANRRLGARQRDHDHVVEVGHFDADGGLILRTAKTMPGEAIRQLVKWTLSRHIVTRSA